jgi:alkaline phosphatase D
MRGAGRVGQGILVLLALALAAPSAPAGSQAPILVTVGEVAETRAVLWVRGASAGRLLIRYGPASGGEERRVEVTATAASDLTVKVALTGLAPGARQRYTVSQGPARVEGRFVTAPPADAAAPVSLVWSGDLGSHGNCRHITDGYPIFRALRAVDADFFLFVGDTVYADHICDGPDTVPGNTFVARTLGQYRAKHRYNRSDPAVQAYFRGIGVYAIWDDHEVRNDFSGPVDPLMPAGRQAFIDYFPVTPPADEPGRLYRRIRWGRLLDVFILDTRQYRSPNAKIDGPDKSMLGPVQRQWLLDGVRGSRATWKVVVTSVSLSIPTGRGARDSWSNASPRGVPEPGGTGFATERDAILKSFREARVSNLVFLAADVHHAELIRHEPSHDWSFHEFVAGPLSASLGRVRPLDAALRPVSLFGLGGVGNFGHISIDEGRLSVRVVDMTGQVRGTHRLSPTP